MSVGIPRWLRMTGRAIVATLFLFVGLEAVALTYGPLKGWYYRTFRQPEILSRQFIEEARLDGLDEQRKKLIEVWRAGKEEYGIHRTGHSVEGTPIGFTLVVERGVATLVLDYTRDSYSNRTFRSESPVTLSLITRERPAAPHNATYLRCVASPDEKPVWF